MHLGDTGEQNHPGHAKASALHTNIETTSILRTCLTLVCCSNLVKDLGLFRLKQGVQRYRRGTVHKLF